MAEDEEAPGSAASPFDHLALRVKDLAASKAFYREVQVVPLPLASFQVDLEGHLAAGGAPFELDPSFGSGIRCVREARVSQSRTSRFTAILEQEGEGYVALCPELDIASQGASLEEALANLREAVELFLECADSREVEERLHGTVFVTQFEARLAEAS